MALYQPGKRSNIALLLSSIFTMSLLTIMIAGHLILALYLWGKITENAGMNTISIFTTCPESALWGSIIAAFCMDLWIFTHMGKAHEKAQRR